MKLAVIRYNAGNLQSVAFALERIGVSFDITDDADAIRSADKVIFPGVGEASTTMQYLRKNGLDNVIRSLTQPVLGICLGMQLLCNHSEENDTECLGIFDATVKKFDTSLGIQVPHVGWNQVTNVSGWLDKHLEKKFVYFVHSFYVPLTSFTTARTEYGVSFSSALRKDNFFAVQFHPERSADAGELVLKSFLDLA